eukprot:COSAG03_NODE_1735_length_3585_cov_13.318703_2_plen_185_part_00
MLKQWELQKQILSMARALGIIGVLPAFQGNMPPQIKWSYPHANISAGDWHGQPGDEASTKGVCAWVAGSDPLFGQVADEWMRTMIADWGTDHWYQCDGFFTGLPPPWDDAINTDDRTQLTATRDAPPPTAVVDASRVPTPLNTPLYRHSSLTVSRYRDGLVCAGRAGPSVDVGLERRVGRNGSC